MDTAFRRYRLQHDTYLVWTMIINISLTTINYMDSVSRSLFISIDIEYHAINPIQIMQHI